MSETIFRKFNTHAVQACWEKPIGVVAKKQAFLALNTGGYGGRLCTAREVRMLGRCSKFENGQVPSLRLVAPPPGQSWRFCDTRTHNRCQVLASFVVSQETGAVKLV